MYDDGEEEKDDLSELPCGIPMQNDQISNNEDRSLIFRIARDMNGQFMVRWPNSMPIVLNDNDMENIESIENKISTLLGKTENNPLVMKKSCLYYLSKYLATKEISIDDMTMRHVAMYCRTKMQEYQIDGILTPRCLDIIEHLFKIKPNTKITELLVINCHLFMECSPNNPTLPTLEELREFNRNQREMMGYLESQGGDSTYHDRQRVYIGLPSIEQFKSTLVQSMESDCMMCCYELEKDQDVYKFPCGHTFHRNNPECQRDESDEIVEWFKQHVRCPVCKADIRGYLMST